MYAHVHVHVHSHAHVRVHLHVHVCVHLHVHVRVRTKMIGLKSHENVSIAGIQIAAAMRPPKMMETGLITTGPSDGAE